MFDFSRGDFDEAIAKGRSAFKPLPVLSLVSKAEGKGESQRSEVRIRELN